MVVNCRNALISRFLDELAAIKAKRPAAAIHEEGEEEEEGEAKEEKKALVLQPPPPGKDRSVVSEEPAAAVAATPTETVVNLDENRSVEKMTRTSSLKTKKCVSFSPAPSFDDDPALNIDSSLSDTPGSQDKRRKRRLRKQDSFEAIEEQEGHNVDGLSNAGSGGGPFGHQRNATLRGKHLSTGRAVRRPKKVRTITSVNIYERKTSSNSLDMEFDAETMSSGILEGSGEIIDLQILEEKISTPTSVKEAAFHRRPPQSEMAPPIAKPESVIISLPSSPSRRSPVQDTEDQFPDILECIKPVPPVKFTPISDDKPDSASNGSIVPETTLAATTRDVERAQRLSRTRWWQKMYSSTEHDLVHDPAEDQRESSV